MRKEYTCIVCPRSCDLILEEEKEQISVTGNCCKRGEEYARNEYRHPMRMITTTVKLKNALNRTLPVISSASVPRELLKDCLDYLYNLEIEAPVKLHEVIVDNILDTGVKVIAARDAERMK